MVEPTVSSVPDTDLEAGLEPKHCYEKDGFMFCNWVKRKGRIIKPRKKLYLRFPARFKRKRRTNLGTAGTGIVPD